MSADDRRPRLTPPAFVVVLLAVACYWRIGYGYGTGDHEELLPQLLRALDPTLFPRDPYLLAEDDAFSVRFVWLGLLRLTCLVVPPPVAVFAWSVVSWAGVSWAAWRFCALLVPSRAAATLAVLMTIATVHWVPGGNALISRTLVPESLAWIPCLLAIEAFARERVYRAAILLGVTAWIQPLMGLQVGLMLGLVALWQMRDGAPRAAFIRAIRFGGLFVVVAAPILVPTLLTQSGTAPPDDGLPTFYITAQLRQAHHYLLFAQAPAALVKFGLIVAAGLAGLVVLRKPGNMIGRPPTNPTPDNIGAALDSRLPNRPTTSPLPSGEGQGEGGDGQIRRTTASVRDRVSSPSLEGGTRASGGRVFPAPDADPNTPTGYAGAPSRGRPSLRHRLRDTLSALSEARTLRFAVRTLAVIAALVAFYVAMTEGAHSLTVAKMQFFRLTLVAKLILVTWASGAIVALVPALDRFAETATRQRLVGWAATLAAVVLTAGLAVAGVGRPADVWRPTQHRATDLYAAEHWISQNTPRDALFLVPPGTTSFRSHALRSVAINFKPTTFRDNAMHCWLARLRIVAPAPLPPLDARRAGVMAWREALDPAYHATQDWSQLADTFDADYALIDQSATPTPPAGDPIYQSGRWAVYRLSGER